MKNLFWVLLSAFAALLFVACDDDGASAKKSDDGEEVAHVVDTLYVFSKDTVYFVDTTHYVDTVVVRDSIYSYGLDGTSCTTSSVGDTAVMIVCGKDTAYVYNGQDASSKGLGTYIVKAVRQGTYDPSKDGSCSLKDYGKYVELKCGNMVLSLYAAECNGSSYDPDSSICYDNTLYPRSEKMVCHVSRSDTYELFERATHFCSDGAIYERCGGKSYEPRYETCVDGVIAKHCDGVVYDASAFFCDNKRIFEKCSGKWFDPDRFTCVDDSLKTMCGSVEYDTLTQYCYNEKVYEDWDGNYKTFTDKRDGKKYKYVQIGDLYWMAEALVYDVKLGGVPISRCNNDCSVRYYLPEVLDTICPDGWRMPTRIEALYLNRAGLGVGNKALYLDGKSGNPLGFSSVEESFYVGDGDEYCENCATSLFCKDEQGACLYLLGYLYVRDYEENLYAIRCVKEP